MRPSACWRGRTRSARSSAASSGRSGGSSSAPGPTCWPADRATPSGSSARLRGVRPDRREGRNPGDPRGAARGGNLYPRGSRRGGGTAEPDRRGGRRRQRGRGRAGRMAHGQGQGTRPQRVDRGCRAAGQGGGQAGGGNPVSPRPDLDAAHARARAAAWEPACRGSAGGPGRPGRGRAQGRPGVIVAGPRPARRAAIRCPGPTPACAGRVTGAGSAVPLSRPGSHRRPAARRRSGRRRRRLPERQPRRPPLRRGRAGGSPAG